MIWFPWSATELCADFSLLVDCYHLAVECGTTTFTEQSFSYLIEHPTIMRNSKSEQNRQFTSECRLGSLPSHTPSRKGVGERGSTNNKLWQILFIKDREFAQNWSWEPCKCFTEWTERKNRFEWKFIFLFISVESGIPHPLVSRLPPACVGSRGPTRRHTFMLWFVGCLLGSGLI